MNPIAIIDCAITSPSYNCMNQIIQRYNLPFTYHLVSQFGCSSLELIDPPSGYIIFGSDSNVFQRLDWQVDLAKTMKQKIEEGVPTLGICFGHQLIADCYGAKIDLVTEDNKCFEGTRELKIIKDIHGFSNGDQLSLYITHHYEVKNLPDNFIHIATSDDCRFDGIAHKTKPFFSFQGHPEASMDFVKNHIEVELTGEQLDAADIGGQRVISNFIDLVKRLNS